MTPSAESVRQSSVGARFNVADRLALTFCFATLVFLIWGIVVTTVKRDPLRAFAIDRLDRKEPALTGSGFGENAVFPTTVAPSMEGALTFYGSWLKTDSSTGSIRSAWVQPSREFYLFVCGYPNRPGNQLFVEIETQGGGQVRIPVSPDEDPGEFWIQKRVHLRGVDDAVKMRVAAVDGSTMPGGWVGFSQLFVVHPNFGFAAIKEFLLVVLCTMASFVFVLGPGLLLRTALSQHSDRYASVVWVPFVGIVGLALLGLIIWLGPHQLSPRLIAKVSLVLFAGYVTRQLVRVPFSAHVTYVEKRALLLVLILAAIGVSKASYSLGPPGELFGHSISRTLEVGGRSDSRLPYHVVQLATQRGDPFGPLGRFLYSSYGVWNFSHRGALTGLASTPIVVASPVRVTAFMPDNPWTVFDPEGFAAFRITAIVMASCCLLAVFGLSRAILPQSWALMAFGVAASAPFVVHEIYFTWPKLIGASFALLGAYFVLKRKGFAAGLALGLGYLCHPSALLATPALLGLTLVSGITRTNVRDLVRKAYEWVRESIFLLLGLSVAVLIWWAVNGKHFEQGMFFSYIRRADGGPPTMTYWLQHRFDSLLKTLVPLHAFFFHRNDPDATAVSGQTPLSVLFALQYWTTLPFGVGIAYFLCLVKLLWTSLRRAPSTLFLVFVLPGLVFPIYWGVANTGLLREGLHAWVLGLMIFSVWILHNHETRNKVFWRLFNLALLLRAVDLFVMTLLPTLLSQGSILQSRFALTDLLFFSIIVASEIALCAVVFWHAENLRKGRLIAEA